MFIYLSFHFQIGHGGYFQIYVNGANFIVGVYTLHVASDVFLVEHVRRDARREEGPRLLGQVGLPAVLPDLTFTIGFVHVVPEFFHEVEAQREQ